MNDAGARLRRRAESAAIRLLGAPTLNALLGSLRWTVSGIEHYDATWGAGIPVMGVLWHGRLLPIAYYHRHQNLGTLISHHRDGDNIAGVAESWGYTTLRGSSSRGGGEAFAEMVRLLRCGTGVAITPDGPRGPRQKLKRGSIYAAQRSGAPIMPVSAAADRAWWFESWDRFLVPKPFARVHLAYGEPLYVPPEADEQELERLRELTEDRLNELTERVDAETR